MDIRDAIRAAREKGLDLVEVAATADPPVCRIIDFGKFQYEAKKKANEAKKKQVTITVKEVKFRPGTDDHDYDYRMKHAREWLEEGDKVKADDLVSRTRNDAPRAGRANPGEAGKGFGGRWRSRSPAAHGREPDVHHLRAQATQRRRGGKAEHRPAPQLAAS